MAAIRELIEQQEQPEVINNSLVLTLRKRKNKNDVETDMHLLTNKT